MKSFFVSFMAVLYLIIAFCTLFVIAFSPFIFFLITKNGWFLLGFLISIPLTTYIMGGGQE